MSDASEEVVHQEHVTSVKPYLVVFGALVIFTLMSFVFNTMVHHEAMTPMAGLWAILIVAVCKAVLVGTYFMHLIHDWGKLYFMIVPIAILSGLMVVVLMPDIVLGWD